jgi:anaerobic dimethyl sulfoxide reductase subunit C (anchor subunit)
MLINKGGDAMLSEEMPLLWFSLLTQLAVGTYCSLLFIRERLRLHDGAVAGKATRTGSLCVALLMAAAILVSMLHLGSPFGAYRAIINIGSSWLSREILLTGAFFGLAVLDYYAGWKGKTIAGLRWLTVIVGLALVYATASLYVASIRPAWNGIHTYIAFFGTTLALGALGAAAVSSFSARGGIMTPYLWAVLRKLIYLSALGIFLPLLFMPMYIAGLSAGGAAALASAKLMGEIYSWPLLLRWVLSLAGLSFLFFRILRKVEDGRQLSLNAVYAAAVLIVAGEVIGRYLFYATAVSIKIG